MVLFFYLKLLFFIIAIEEAQLKLERKGEKTVTLRSVSRLPVGSRFVDIFSPTLFHAFAHCFIYFTIVGRDGTTRGPRPPSFFKISILILIKS